VQSSYLIGYALKKDRHGDAGLAFTSYSLTSASIPCDLLSDNSFLNCVTISFIVGMAKGLEAPAPKKKRFDHEEFEKTILESSYEIETCD